MATKVQIIQVAVIVFDINDLIVHPGRLGARLVDANNVLDPRQRGIVLDIGRHVPLVCSVLSRRVGCNEHGRSLVVFGLLKLAV
jgi:hypothetical protein